MIPFSDPIADPKANVVRANDKTPGGMGKRRKWRAIGLREFNLVAANCEAVELLRPIIAIFLSRNPIEREEARVHANGRIIRPKKKEKKDRNHEAGKKTAIEIGELRDNDDDENKNAKGSQNENENGKEK
jgi:hypothetical protein